MVDGRWFKLKRFRSRYSCSSCCSRVISRWRKSLEANTKPFSPFHFFISFKTQYLLATVNHLHFFHGIISYSLLSSFSLCIGMRMRVTRCHLVCTLLNSFLLMIHPNYISSTLVMDTHGRTKTKISKHRNQMSNLSPKLFFSRIQQLHLLLRTRTF